MLYTILLLMLALSALWIWVWFKESQQTLNQMSEALNRAPAEDSEEEEN